MSDHNPLVQADIQDTLNKAIDSLQFVIAALPNGDRDNLEEHRYSPVDLARLANMSGCVKAAFENCYGQSCSENRSAG